MARNTKLPGKGLSEKNPEVAFKSAVEGFQAFAPESDATCRRQLLKRGQSQGPLVSPS